MGKYTLLVDQKRHFVKSTESAIEYTVVDNEDSEEIDYVDIIEMLDKIYESLALLSLAADTRTDYGFGVANGIQMSADFIKTFKKEQFDE